MSAGRPPISGRTRLLGIFADPIDHVQTPMVFNDFLEQRGIDAVFMPLHVSPAHLEAAMLGMRHLHNFAGSTLTIPHKIAAMRHCDVLLPRALACGAVNAVRVQPDGRLLGDNYDGLGMVTAITAQRPLEHTTRALLVGAGGAGRAIAVALASAGVGLLAIANRTRARADDLAHTVRQVVPTCEVETGTHFDPAPFDLVVNATSLGLHGHGALPLEVTRLSPGTLVADAVMLPAMTPLLQAARERGLRIVRGAEMLRHQIAGLAEFFGLLTPDRDRQ
ncbi:MAG: shikimate dehydrogenase [Candidatus Tectimicrobiota bacterium]